MNCYDGLQSEVRPKSALVHSVSMEVGEAGNLAEPHTAEGARKACMTDGMSANIQTVSTSSPR